MAVEGGRKVSARRLDYSPLVDEIVVHLDQHDAVISLYKTGVRVTLWEAGACRLLYIDRIPFNEYPEIVGLVLCDELLYRECRALVDGLVNEVLE